MMIKKRTTVALELSLFRAIKEEAARRGQAFQEYVNELLRISIQKQTPKKELKSYSSLPSYSMGLPPVDPADRNALFEFLERH